MSKILIETTGAFGLIDIGAGMVEIHATRPTVVASTPFVQGRIALGQVRLLVELPSEATDAAWAEFLANSDGEVDLAIDSYVASFGEPEFDAEVTIERIKELGGKANKRMSPETLKKILTELEAKVA